ncbi:MAG: hypothetical protein NWF07_09560 [Candidatus Bathyarchaeota archaeon]|nr:hypothetical protein [Candidatus Bathyarchaeota archaeon]
MIDKTTEPIRLSKPHNEPIDIGLEVVVKNEANPLYYINFYDELISLLMESTGEKKPRSLTRLASKMTLINESPFTIYLLFHLYGAFTLPVLNVELRLLGSDISESTVRRVVRDLEHQGVIVKHFKAGPGEKGGRRSYVYKVLNASPEQVNKAFDRERRRQSPRFDLVVKAVQMLIDEYLEPRDLKEITGDIVTVHLRDWRSCGRLAMRGFSFGDIKEATLTELHEHGVKVIR